MIQNNNIEVNLAEQRKGRMVFLLMIIFFIVPIIVVVMMYQYNWKPSGESLGELIKPPRSIQTPVYILNSEAKPLSPLLWKEKWSIIYITNACAQTCMEKLSEMRRLHVSLYKDITRVQRVLITNTLDTATIKQSYPDLIVINQPKVNINDLTTQFKVGTENPELSSRIYLVDPLGFLMMSYPANTPLVNVRKDVVRLLKYSWAG